MSRKALGRLGTVESGIGVGIGNELADTRQAVDVADYCAVTLLCSGRRVDVNLPASLPWADLQANVVRLLAPTGAQVASGLWELVPIGRPPLNPAESLCSAGVLDGDVLCLRPVVDDHGSRHRIVVSVRDNVEDAVEGRGESWTSRTSFQFVVWFATAFGGILVIPAGAMTADIGTVGLSFSVAIILVMIAVCCARRDETVCGAIAVVVSCGWAATGGCAVVGALAAPDQVNSFALGVVGSSLISDIPQFAGLAAAAGSALLIAICATMLTPFALIHATCLGVIAAVFGGLSFAIASGGHAAQTCFCAAVLTLLAIGIAPRVALAMSGLSALVAGDEAREPSSGTAAASPATCGAQNLDQRVIRAHQLLTGMLIGLSSVAVLSVTPVLVSTQWWHRALVAGIGVSLLLRSRAFSQIPHLIAPRVGALLIFTSLAIGVCRGDPSTDSTLIMGSMTIVGALVLFVGWLGPSISPVGRARFGRILDFADGAVIVGLLVLMGGMFGLFSWMTALIG